MMSGMTKSKIAITLPPELVARARSAVRRKRAESVSAYVAAALEEKAKLDDLDELLASMLDASGGPLTNKERLAADTALGATPGSKRRRAR
jgi:hypothetical protein